MLLESPGHSSEPPTRALIWRVALLTLALVAILGTSIGLAFADHDRRQFTRPANATVTVVVSPVLAADVNEDGKVDSTDLETVALNLNMTVPPADPRVDVNGDGVVDIGDISFVARYFGLIFR